MLEYGQTIITKYIQLRISFRLVKMPQLVFLYLIIIAMVIGFAQEYHDKYFNCDDDPSRFCSEFVRRHGCYENPGYSAVFCPSTCGMCDLRNYTKRCDANRIGYNLTNVWESGDMSKMFENINVPHTVLSYDPYVVQIDNVFTEEEAHQIIKIGERYGGYQPSTDQGETDPDTGVQKQTLSSYRTSNNAWCLPGDCENESIVKTVYERINTITQLPFSNSESLQILKYEPGQYYKIHHDARQDEEHNLQGTRILTAFVYLNEVEDGGETTFPDLGLSVKPKLGSMILWPSVKDSDPTIVDLRTVHQADSVTKGIKYGVNIWYHMRDFRIPNKHGCTGNLG